MSSAPSRQHGLWNVALWSVLTPLVGLWPFLSAMPLFTLLGGNVTPVTASLNVLAFVTGFWVALPVAIFLWFMLSDEGKSAYRIKKRSYLLPITVYIIVWTIGYMLLSIMIR